MATRKQGHKLATTWNGRRGVDAVTTGTCLCKKWQTTGPSQVAVRNEYNKHLAAAKKATKPAAKSAGKKKTASKKPAAKKA